MTTALDIVGSALRKISAVDASEPIQPGDFAATVSALNRMMARWEAKGITVGWSPVANPGDVINAPTEAEDAIIYNLSAMVAPEYGVPLSQLAAATAAASLAELKNLVYTSHTMELVNDMPRSSRGTRWNMYTDGPTF